MKYNSIFIIFLVVTFYPFKAIIAKKMITISIVNEHSFFLEDTILRTIPDLELAFQIKKTDIFKQDSIYIVRLRIYPDIPMRTVIKVTDFLQKYQNTIVIQGITNLETFLFTKIIPKPIKKKPPPIKIKRRNLTKIVINAKNKIQIRGQQVKIKDFKTVLKKYIISNKLNPTLPELSVKDLPKLGKIHCVSKHLINLEYYRATHYDTFRTIFKLLNDAYYEVKTDAALKHFKTQYGELPEMDKSIIREIYPYMIRVEEPTF